MSVYRRGKIWWFVFVYEGRRIQESTGLTNKTAAVRAEAKRKADLLERRSGFRRKKLPPKFGEFTPVFLNWSKQGHRRKTYELHRINCDALNRYFKQKWMDDITGGMVEDFKLARVRETRWGRKDETSVSGVTVNRALSTLRLIYHYTERCGYQISNPVKGIEFYEELGRTRIVSPEEEVAYFANASQPLKVLLGSFLTLECGLKKSSESKSIIWIS